MTDADPGSGGDPLPVKGIPSAAETTVLRRARVGCLATVDKSGVPHLVPFCFVFREGVLYSSVDEKPQESEADQLGRVRNIQNTGRAAAVVHHYEEDWTRLGWVQVRGSARILEPGDPDHTRAVDALRGKYSQYKNQSLGERPVIRLRPREVISWGDLNSIPEGP